MADANWLHPVGQVGRPTRSYQWDRFQEATGYPLGFATPIGLPRCYELPTGLPLPIGFPTHPMSQLTTSWLHPQVTQRVDAGGSQS